jgi:hypothetical protein
MQTFINSPLEQFQIFAIFPVVIGNFDFSITNATMMVKHLTILALSCAFFFSSFSIYILCTLEQHKKFLFLCVFFCQTRFSNLFSFVLLEIIQTLKTLKNCFDPFFSITKDVRLVIGRFTFFPQRVFSLGISFKFSAFKLARYGASSFFGILTRCQSLQQFFFLPKSVTTLGNCDFTLLKKNTLVRSLHLRFNATTYNVLVLKSAVRTSLI